MTLLAVWTLRGAPSDAEPVHFRVSVLPEMTGESESRKPTLPKELELAFRRVSEGAVLPAVERRVVTLSGEGDATLELSPGTTLMVKAAAKGFWSPEQPVTVVSPAAPVELALRPAGVVRGKVILDQGTRPGETLDQLMIYFQSSPGVKHAQLERKELVQCPIDPEGGFRCDVPSGDLDVQFRMLAHMPHHRWDLKVPFGAELELGKLVFRRGASLAGWVSVRGESLDPKRCRVHLVPRGMTSRRDEKEARLARAFSREATPTDRGFFFFEGLPPGEYVVAASQGELSPTRTIVKILSGLQAELKEPLLLDLPRRLEIAVRPPKDPWGAAWRLSLTERGPDGADPTGRTLEGRVSESGIWRVKSLPPGRYRLRVESSTGASWLVEEFDIDKVLSPYAIDVPVVPVVGTVRLGRDPLKAEILFGGQFGSIRIPMSSDADGVFTGFLPRTGDWQVTVLSEEPAFARSLAAVSVSKPDDTGNASVEIRMPGTTVHGEVVDENGRPVPGALVNAERRDSREPTTQVPVQTGSFELKGLSFGSYALSAEEGNRSSATVDVTLEDGGEPPSVRLTLRPNLALLGQVVSPAGPVPGATVRAFPVGNRGYVVLNETTNEAGDFSVSLPAGTQEMRFTVIARGFAIRTFRARVPENHYIEVPVNQLGGRLVVGLKKTTTPPPATKGSRALVLLHAGSYESVWFPGTKDMGPEGGLLLPDLEAGEYSVCSVGEADIGMLEAGVLPAGTCAAGYLPPLGDITLKLPAP